MSNASNDVIAEVLLCALMEAICMEHIFSDIHWVPLSNTGSPICRLFKEDIITVNLFTYINIALCC